VIPQGWAREGQVSLFDGLRAVAAVLVFVFHSWAVINSADFVGFASAHRVLAPIWAEDSNRLGVSLFYAIRRAARIIPAYWLVLTVLIAVEGKWNVFTPRGVFDTYLFGQI
jgi:peptidoglycan/LPS O-acetylase OafA/YrhL